MKAPIEISEIIHPNIKSNTRKNMADESTILMLLNR